MKKFIKHTTDTMPKNLTGDTLIVYRTSSTATKISHVHLPIAAKFITWSDEEQCMGAILEYAVYVNKIKNSKIIKYNCEEFIDRIPLLGFHK